MSTQNFQYQNINLSYDTYGEGKPLIVLHGWGSSKRVMTPISKMLSGIRTCYVLDLPGFGESDEPERAWNVDDYADCVEHFINHINLEKVDVLVHSYGGRITLKLCSRDFGKQKIEKVLITGGAGMKPKRSAKFYFKKYFAKTLKSPFMILPSKLRDKSLQWLRTTAVWKSLGSSDYSTLSGVMRETFVKSVNEHLEGCLPKIDHEVLLLWGSNDEATPLYQAERMNKGLKNSALVKIEGGTHYAFLDKPKQFAAIATAFFEAK